MRVAYLDNACLEKDTAGFDIFTVVSRLMEICALFYCTFFLRVSYKTYRDNCINIGNRYSHLIVYNMKECNQREARGNERPGMGVFKYAIMMLV